MQTSSFSLAKLLLAVGVIGMGLSLQGATITLGVNGIVNGDAEGGAGSADGSVVPVPGWTVQGNFTAVQYGAPGGFPLLTDPGPADRGTNFFAGGPDNGSSSAAQILDISNIAGLIDAGSVNYLLSGYLGGFSTQDDNAVFTANFVSATGAIVGSAIIGPATEPDRNGLTGLLARAASGIIPAGSRSIDFVLQDTRLEGSYNDGYADKLSFVATASGSVPEPATTGFLMLGLGAMGMAARRFRRL